MNAKTNPYKNEKRIIIVEGADCSGKSCLCKHIQNMCEGKCHTLHSNFSKSVAKDNHRRQHELITKFASDQFSSDNFTGNNIVLLDRCYVSDITYGQIGYGSGGTPQEKFQLLFKYFSNLTSNPEVRVTFIYCKPQGIISTFGDGSKEELLDNEENNKMRDIYDNTLFSPDFIYGIINKLNMQFVIYDYEEDPNYELLDSTIARFTTY